MCDRGIRMFFATSNGIPMLKVRRSRDRLIFHMGIAILVRRLYIGMVSRRLKARSESSIGQMLNWSDRAYDERHYITFLYILAQKTTYSPDKIR